MIEASGHLGKLETPEPEPMEPSRRLAIKMGLAGLAGLGISALAPGTALATTGGMTYGTSNDSGGDMTTLTSATASETLDLFNTNATNGSVLFCRQDGGTSYCAQFVHTGSGPSVEVLPSGIGYGVYVLLPFTSPSSAVRAQTNGTGYAIEAMGANALKVNGIVTLNRSGVVAVPKGKSYVTITVPSGLSSSSSFLATLQGNAGSGVAVAYAAKTAATTFRAYFTKKTTKATKVGWVVLG
jgi:hypothetical protein